MTTSSTSRYGSWVRILGIIIAVAGLGVAAYMSWAELTGNATVCPGHTEEATGEPGTIIVDCGFVQNSIYANIFGIPVALMGVAGYFGIIAIWMLEKRLTFLADYSAILIFGMALFGFLFSAYLTYTELFIMYTVCTWCIASAVLMTLLFIIAAVQLANSMRIA